MYSFFSYNIVYFNQLIINHCRVSLFSEATNSVHIPIILILTRIIYEYSHSGALYAVLRAQ